MKEQVKEMFEQVTMPETCEWKIRRAMAGKAEGRTVRRTRPVFRPATVMAALLAVLLFCSVAMNNQVHAAVRELVKRYVFNEESFAVEIHEGEMAEASFNTGAALYAESRDGRLYFVANGENIDITDETSMEKPYIHSYIDGENIEHMLFIGGTPENFGIHEFYREVSDNQKSWEGWIGGYGTNYLDNQTGKAYPWVVAAWEELNLPWPVPGT